jgi:hypothetical protein
LLRHLKNVALADRVLPQQIGDGNAALGVPEDLDDLRLAEFRLPHDRSLPEAVYRRTVDRSGKLTLTLG